MSALQLADAQADLPYIHGFSAAEQARLVRQARFSEAMVYRDVDFSGVQKLLEVGCGVGAQTEILLRRFPDVGITGLDFSQRQLAVARQRLQGSPYHDRATLLHMDAEDLDFPPASFDGAFLCWILEHVHSPERVLAEVRRVLKPGARLYATEAMNATFFLAPYSANLQQYWLAFNDHQLSVGGDPFVGAKLGNILMRLGFRHVETKVKTWHLDSREPHRRQQVLDYWAELLLSAADQLIEAGRVDAELVDSMTRELRLLRSNPELVFFYSFMQASAVV
ncbi:class I SAM-dependent methyltransferase [Chromobacterium violaceum]|uniref:Probable methyltransferase n=1 Tax=Chromobacterium violaceum (strain ATCC 12472 / DSM 30191 / JCM 1249 / CCUG 213 / NBRC 12614 / NCIMB 9131 / NCTC 9757 / MK) TaxID=243365 RepID=Q7NSM5_CHRVO|nr:class I SAM-dependent methyltransferase [Chromobacterium violaceum]AAQ61060.1 probable methyltransferase [Chromobacterium violaceum ATCC 12472]MBA8736292.1 methyltransferase domain-containing protein [Chromobacterium violaceum]SUX39528.1 Rebeccamycin O-methyltransferase [Chromobacterium violaceum]